MLGKLMSNSPKTSRIFFALWPSEQVRQSILDASSLVTSKCKGRHVESHNLHITLHFIGQVSVEEKQCLNEAAKTIAESSLTLKLNRFGYFRQAKVFWMGMQEVPAGLALLQGKLGEALSTCAYEPENRSFTPHVTLMRKCIKPEVEQPDFTIPWLVNEFVLVESLPHASGVDYRVVERYPLG